MCSWLRNRLEKPVGERFYFLPMGGWTAVKCGCGRLEAGVLWVV